MFPLPETNQGGRTVQGWSTGPRAGASEDAPAQPAHKRLTMHWTQKNRSKAVVPAWISRDQSRAAEFAATRER